jgi:hypothetical protein
MEADRAVLKVLICHPFTSFRTGSEESRFTGIRKDLGKGLYYKHMFVMRLSK